MAGAFEDDKMREHLESIGCTDGVDQDQLIQALDVLRAFGGTLPAEPKPAANSDEPAKATGAQVTYAQSLFAKANAVPLAESDLRGLSRERISALIEQLKAGTYDPTEWDVPF